MAVTRYTLTGDFGDIVGDEFNVKSVKAFLSTNLPAGQALVNLADNEIQVGAKELTLDASGAFSVSLIASDSADTNIASGTLEYRVTFSYVNPSTRTRDTWDSGYFELTADADLSDVAGTIEAPVSWRSAFITDMEAIQAAAETAQAAAETARAAAEAAAADATAIVIADVDGAMAAAIETPGTDTNAALSASIAPCARTVVFSDSWGGAIDGASIPALAVGACGGTIVANYYVAGSQLAPEGWGSEPAKTLGAQIATATADTSYNKSTITDVIVLMAVNNIGGYLPTVNEARDMFNAVADLYPKARLHYVANSKKAIFNGADSDPWRWYSRFFAGASLAGFAVAENSPLWHWDANHSTYWPGDALPDARHMVGAGQYAWAYRLAAFLSTGADYKPYFKVPMALHADATAASAGATLYVDKSYIQGTTLNLNCVITGMDTLTAATATKIIQIPPDYAMPVAFTSYPGGAYIGGRIQYNYSFDILSDASVLASDSLLNEHETFFTLRAAIALDTMITD